MKRTVRALAFFLCFCMLLPCIVSCADPDDNGPDVDYDEEYYDDSSREKTKGNLPEDLDLEGETLGFYFFSPLQLEIEGEFEETDMVYTSIYERNQKVKSWLNMNFTFTPSDSDYWADVSGEVTNLVYTADETLDVVIAGGNSLIQNKLYALFLDLNNTLFLELNQPWWNMNAIKEVSLDGRIFEFLFGDILLSNIAESSAIFYNKNLYEELNPSEGKDHLYHMVDDGTWTLDQFYYISNKTYVDKDGDQTRSNQDIYAFQLFRYAEPIHAFANNAEVEYYKRLKTGFPQITINSTKAVEFTEILYKIIYQNQGADLYYPNQIGKEVEHPHDFQDGRILFNLSTLGLALNEFTRAMEDDYGIIPYPKWDEAQAEYHAFIGGGSPMVCVPYTVATGGDYDRLEYVICAVLEAMAIESYRSVTENFYDLALKSSYTRDDIASDMIDIIVGSAFKNVVYEYSTSLNNVGHIFSNIMQAQSYNFASRYESIGESADNLLTALIKEYGTVFK